MYIIEVNWSEGFRDQITKQIVTFTWAGKPLKLGTEIMYDPAVIYGFFNQVSEVSILMIYWYKNWIHSQLLCLTLHLKRR